MRTAAVFAKDTAKLMPKNPTLRTVLVNGVEVTCGLVAKPNDIPRQAPPGHILVRVRAFSCTCRDKPLILQTATLARPDTFCTIGSDFCADVLDTGPGVEGFDPGDLVILNPTPKNLSARRGSREYQVVPATDVLPVPHGSPIEDLATLGTAAKTAYGLIRISQVRPSMRVLVTAGRSSVSMALLNALALRKVQPDVVTSSVNLDARFEELGAGRVLHAAPPAANTPLMDCGEVVAHARASGGYDVVFDPFFTSYFERLAPVLKPGAIYASCGFSSRLTLTSDADYPASEPPLPPSHSMKAALALGIINNIELRLITLGSTEDLQHALGDFGQGSYRAPVDRVFDGGNVGGMIERTYCSPERMGRVVYRYN